MITMGCILRLRPTISGLKMFPSINCRIKIVTITMITALAEIASERSSAGTAPINGPKYGMTFVIPMARPKISG